MYVLISSPNQRFGIIIFPGYSWFRPVLRKSIDSELAKTPLLVKFDNVLVDINKKVSGIIDVYVDIKDELKK